MAIAVAVQGHDHKCPLYAGKKAHKGGPIIGGESGLTINGIAVALVGHQCSCEVAGPDVIVQGAPGLTVNGIAVALKGSPTAHGGQITEGDSAMTVA